MKKIFVLLMVLCILISGAFASGAKEKAPAAAASGDTPLVAAAKAEGELIVYGSCEEEYLAAHVRSSSRCTESP